MEMDKNYGKDSLNVNIPWLLKKAVKKIADRENTTVTDIVIAALIGSIREYDKNLLAKIANGDLKDE